MWPRPGASRSALRPAIPAWLADIQYMPGVGGHVVACKNVRQTPDFDRGRQSDDNHGPAWKGRHRWVAVTSHS